MMLAILGANDRVPCSKFVRLHVSYGNGAVEEAPDGGKPPDKQFRRSSTLGSSSETLRGSGSRVFVPVY